VEVTVPNLEIGLWLQRIIPCSYIIPGEIIKEEVE
jgi:hypothetical protein